MALHRASLVARSIPSSRTGRRRRAARGPLPQPPLRRSGARSAPSWAGHVAAHSRPSSEAGAILLGARQPPQPQPSSALCAWFCPFWMFVVSRWCTMQCVWGRLMHGAATAAAHAQCQHRMMHCDAHRPGCSMPGLELHRRVGCCRRPGLQHCSPRPNGRCWAASEWRPWSRPHPSCKPSLRSSCQCDHRRLGTSNCLLNRRAQPWRETGPVEAGSTRNGGRVGAAVTRAPMPRATRPPACKLAGVPGPSPLTQRFSASPRCSRRAQSRNRHPTEFEHSHTMFSSLAKLAEALAAGPEVRSD